MVGLGHKNMQQSSQSVSRGDLAAAFTMKA